MVTNQIRSEVADLDDQIKKAKIESLLDEADRIHTQTISHYESKLDELRDKGIIQDRKPRG